MGFQNQFNQFVRNGGTKILLVRNNGLSSKMNLDNNVGVESGLYMLGHHPVKDVAIDKGQLKIYLGKPKNEKPRVYTYAYSKKDFVFAEK